MPSCKDCLLSDVCVDRYVCGDRPACACQRFKDRNRFVVLPKYGDTVYGFDYTRDDIKVVVPEEVTGIAIYTDCDFYNITDLGKTVFLTREEAERALKERENNG